MSRFLFRREVLQSLRTSWLGSISLSLPLSIRVLTGFSAILALSVLIFLFTGTYSHRSTVIGQLVPVKGVATVMAPSTGVLNQVYVHEGGVIRKGQMLGVVVVPSATPRIGDTMLALQRYLSQREEGLKSSRRAELQQLTAQEEGLRAQLASLRHVLEQMGGEVSTKRNQIALAKEVLERWRQLQKEEFVSALQINRQESNVLDYTGEMQALQRQMTETQRSISQVEQQLRALPGQFGVVQANYLRDYASLEQEQVQMQADGASVITAPVSGVVTNQLVKIGQAVQKGQPLISLLQSDDRLEAELLVPSRSIGFVEPGNVVMLRYQAYSYQKFGHQSGTVLRISRSALSPSELASLAGISKGGDSYYRVTVMLKRQTIMAYGKPEILKPGMLLEADIVGERRRLIEWILEPLYSIKGKIN
ncbi:HlyD family secretion protein [Xanthomonas sacchari]